MTDAAAQDLAQHIAAAFVRRQHAVVDEEGGGAGVIGDDAQAMASVQAGRPSATRVECGSPLSISGVNRSVSKFESLPCSTAATRSRPMPVSIEGLGSGVSVARLAGASRVELHEDEVPDLDVAGVVLAEGLIDAGVSAASMPMS